MDPVLGWLLHKTLQERDSRHAVSGMVSFGLWLVFAKVVKLIPHFYRYPTDIRFIPLAVGFGYLHGFIKIYALLTLNMVGSLTTKNCNTVLTMKRQPGVDGQQNMMTKEYDFQTGPASESRVMLIV